jgi:hypothetical protein
MDDVLCGSNPVIDGWTGKPIDGAWMYGPHFAERMPPGGKCPRCGLDLSGIPMVGGFSPKETAEFKARILRQRATEHD